MSMQSGLTSSFSGGALVSRAGEGLSGPAQYLQLSPDGGVLWVLDPLNATPFPSMRDAARMAVRLPARRRAFALPMVWR